MLGPQPSFGGKDQRHLQATMSSVMATQSGNHSDHSLNKATSQNTNSKLKSYVELLDIKILKEIRTKFLEHGGGESGDSLKVEDFVNVLSHYMSRSDVEKVYKKIDINDDGYVDWHEFTGFLINSDSMKAGSTNYGPLYGIKERCSQFPDRHAHRDMIEHLAFSLKPVPMIVTGCKDGSISLWNYSDLSYISSISHHDKNSIMLSNMIKHISTAQKAAVKVAVGKLSNSSPTDGVLITALATLSTTGHLCVASADCSMSVYELGTQELCSRLSNTTEIVTAIAAFQVVDKRLEHLVPHIVTGDAHGFIGVVKIDHEFGLSIDGGQKKKNQLLLDRALGQGLDRNKVHSDWVTQLFFLPELEQIISASMDGKIKFISVDKLAVVREFNGHIISGFGSSVGVKRFVWAPVQKYVVSAGTDRTILMWDPYTLDVMCKLTGISSPVVEIAIDEKYQQIIASTQKKSIRSWDSVTYEDLDPVEDRQDYQPINEISCSLWIPDTRSLITGSSKLKLYSVEKNLDGVGAAVEQEDLNCALYNDVFHQVVVISNSGRVKVFLLEDGSLISQFNARSVSNKSEDLTNIDYDFTAFVKLAQFDGPKRRLIIVTAANNVQFWNCHNGSSLFVVTPRIPPYLVDQFDGSSNSTALQITCMIHECIMFPVSTVQGGSTRTIAKKHLLLGLQNGIIIGLHEADVLSEDASILLVRTATVNNKSKSKDGVIDREFDELTPTHGIGRRASTHRKASVPPRRSGGDSSSLLWLKSAGNVENFIIAGYNDGIILLWDVSTANVVMHMEADSPGASFSCMRRQIITSRNRAPPMTVYLEKQRQLQRMRDGSDDLKTLQSAKLSQDKASAAQLAPEDITQFHYSFLEVEKSIQPMGSIISDKQSNNLGSFSVESKVLKANPQAKSSSRNHRNQGKYAGSSLIKENSPFGFHFYSKGTIVGVGRRDSSKPASFFHKAEAVPMSPIQNRQLKSTETQDGDLNQEPDTASFYSTETDVPNISAPEPKPPSQLIHQRRPFSGNDRLQSTVQKSNSDLPTNRVTNTGKARESVEAWTDSYEHPSVRTSRSHHQLPYLPLAIYHTIISSNYRLLFGACSDSLLRIWDLDSAEVICSCESVHSAAEIKVMRGSSGEDAVPLHDDSESSISKLGISERSNHLIAGYDDGLVRVWQLGVHSTGQLRTVTVTDNGELAIPPMQYHSEWLAHDTAISGIEVICRENDSGSGYSCYVLTSGQAQGVYLWTLGGSIIGTFGAAEWRLEDKATWRAKVDDNFDLKQIQSNLRGKKLTRGQSSGSGSVDSQDPNYEWGKGISRSLKLMLYMEKIKERSQYRQGISAYAMQDDQFSDIQIRHPVTAPRPPSPMQRSGRQRPQRQPVQDTNRQNFGASGPVAVKRRNNAIAVKLNNALTASAESSLRKLMGDEIKNGDPTQCPPLSSPVPYKDPTNCSGKVDSFPALSSPRVVPMLSTTKYNGIGITVESFEISQ